MLSETRWDEARACVGQMVEVGQKVGPPIHGRLEYIPENIQARRATIVIFVKDDPEGVDRKRSVKCRDVVGIVIQPRRAT